MAAELLGSEKERAEHVMLVDLERNDIGKVAAYGTVRVPELMTVEQYSHVMHLVSQVEGRLAPGKDAFDVIAALFQGERSRERRRCARWRSSRSWNRSDAARIRAPWAGLTTMEIWN